MGDNNCNTADKTHSRDRVHSTWHIFIGPRPTGSYTQNSFPSWIYSARETVVPPAAYSKRTHFLTHAAQKNKPN